jgi:hypothetical protein
MAYTYIESPIMGCAVKLDSKNKIAWAKYPEKDEFQVSWDSQTVSDALVYGKELTEEEYNIYVEP